MTSPSSWWRPLHFAAKRLSRAIGSEDCMARIGLVAHDDKKDELVAWALNNRDLTR